MVPEPASVERFARDLDALIAPDARLGLAVSGGPDSLALLMLAAAARPGSVRAATVDHQLREGSRAEAMTVAALCKQVGIPHTVLTAEWDEQPTTGIQERARRERYGLLADWAQHSGVDALATGHHADDQAETLLMRLNRGSGVRGLAGMRPRALTPGSSLLLLRPLLAWRRSELQQVCAYAGLDPACDPSNSDPHFERARVRQALRTAEWLDASALASSAAHLASADEALAWASDQEWRRRASREGLAIVVDPADAPAEILRRLLMRALETLAVEGVQEPLRRRELDPILTTLGGGGTATIRGVLCQGGDRWRFFPAPPRRSSAAS